jgi:predicted nucleic acid-binding protein
LRQCQNRLGADAGPRPRWNETPLSYLFDTDAISELLRRQPAPKYLAWVQTVPREDQFISAVTVGELYQGAFRSEARERHLMNIEERLLPAVTVLPFDTAVAKVFGEIRASLEAAGTRLADADLQIAATALYHDLTLVTGNVRHFDRIPKLHIDRVLVEAKRPR